MNPTTIDARNTTTESRILREGYGDGAWHGPDIKAALADVSAEAAFRRPAAGRHNIAEIALHHAYTTRNVRAKLTGVEPDAFVLPGDDWFDVADASILSWQNTLDVVRGEQERLADVVRAIENGRTTSPVPDSERFDLVLGITCHAAYHAGQIQLVKRLIAP